MKQNTSILNNDIHIFSLSEGSPCNMHDGRKGTCKNIDHCDSIKQALRHGQLRLQNIVGCSFVVNKIKLVINFDIHTDIHLDFQFSLEGYSTNCLLR